LPKKGVHILASERLEVLPGNGRLPEAMVLLEALELCDDLLGLRAETW